MSFCTSVRLSARLSVPYEIRITENHKTEIVVNVPEDMSNRYAILRAEAATAFSAS